MYSENTRRLLFPRSRLIFAPFALLCLSRLLWSLWWRSKTRLDVSCRINDTCALYRRRCRRRLRHAVCHIAGSMYVNGCRTATVATRSARSYRMVWIDNIKGKREDVVGFGLCGPLWFDPYKASNDVNRPRRNISSTLMNRKCTRLRPDIFLSGKICGKS